MGDENGLYDKEEPNAFMAHPDIFCIEVSRAIWGPSTGTT